MSALRHPAPGRGSRPRRGRRRDDEAGLGAQGRGGSSRPALPPRLSQPAGLLIATFTFACAWVVTAALATMRAPGWAIFIGCVLIIVSIVALMVTLHRWAQGGTGGEGGPDSRDDHGGGGPRLPCPDAPRDGDAGLDASWWDEFERDLALYVAEREVAKQHGRPTYELTGDSRQAAIWSSTAGETPEAEITQVCPSLRHVTTVRPSTVRVCTLYPFSRLEGADGAGSGAPPTIVYAALAPYEL